MNQSPPMPTITLGGLLLCFSGFMFCPVAHSEELLQARATSAMRKATRYFAENLSVRGGYVYYYDLQLQERWGEGRATADQIWVQPPGTPAVGLAFLDAWKATGDDLHLKAARAAAEALLYGQLRSGGWTNCIDFNPRGSRVAQYRGQALHGKNYSSLDDDQTTAALRFLMQLDRALKFNDPRLHEATLLALDRLLAAQYPCGGFPQVWNRHQKQVPDAPLAASYPDYKWRTEGRIKEYWHLYTLNDDVALHVAKTLIQAGAIYREPKYQAGLRRLGDFLIRAQMPEPQPAWAQQYNFAMHPTWARAFEPPAIAARESQGVIQALMQIFEQTGEEKYLQPIPAAIRYLRRSELDDGQLARYYELETNFPLYMTRTGGRYELTYRDTQLPSHYGWKSTSKVDVLQRRFDQLYANLQSDLQSQNPTSAEPGVSEQNPGRSKPAKASTVTEDDIQQILNALDSQGRWISTYEGQNLVGQPNFMPGQRFISSAVFVRNITALARFVTSDKD